MSDVQVGKKLFWCNLKTGLLDNLLESTEGRKGILTKMTPNTKMKVNGSNPELDGSDYLKLHKTVNVSSSVISV